MGWIYCKDKLPPKGEWVLVTRNEYQKPVEIMCYQGIRTNRRTNDHGEWEDYRYPSWTSGHGDIQGRHPLAWMEVPLVPEDHPYFNDIKSEIDFNKRMRGET